MSAAQVYAEHGPWRCWLRWDDRRAPLLELVWMLSGMVPRVLVQVGPADEADAPGGKLVGSDSEPFGSDALLALLQQRSAEWAS